MPPPQLEQSHIGLFVSWVSDNLDKIIGVLGGAGVLIGIVFRLGKRKKEYEGLQSTVNEVKTNQIKVISLIPKESWEDGVMLISSQGCSKERVDCRTRVIVNNYREELAIIKEAVGVLIFHSKEIPPDEREKQYKSLMK